MLASISPVGEASRGQRWPITVSAYLVGSTTGGAMVGALAGLVGAGVAALTGPWGLGWRLALFAAAGAVTVAIDRGLVPLRLPSWQRQVDERWLTTYRGWVYGIGFGFQLGAGLLTRIATAAVYLMLVAAALTGSVATGALIGGVFGLTRSLPLVTTAPLRDPASLRGYHQRLDAASTLAVRTTDVVVLGATAAALAVALIG
jgi:sulfite exporter TauE/SafE